MSEGKTPPAPAAQPAPQVRVVSQYVKDFSLENPNFERFLGGPIENPNIQVEVNCGARRLKEPNLYESLLAAKATASNSKGTLYDLELEYIGVFQLDNFPPQALEPFLLVNCPTLLFPFARRVIADMTREAGYPPLLLDQIDFGRMFMERMKEAEGSGANGSISKG
jgi:preprotein translocase subunit SecB